jgi:copper chaperone NosL
MKNRARFTFGAVTMVLPLAAALTGCGGQTEYKPAAIQEGVDRCVECNMLIADDHHATQILLKDGKSLKFDDIGDLFLHKKKHQLEEQVGAEFVRDYRTTEWLELKNAFFVYDASFRTPMAYGIYSFKTKADAEKFIQEQGKGKLMTSADLEKHSWDRNMDSMKHMSSPMHNPDMNNHMKDNGASKENMTK